MRYTTFCPTEDLFPDSETYEYTISQIVELLSEQIYMENKLALNGINFQLTDE